jgi:hypothetical protein
MQLEQEVRFACRAWLGRALGARRMQALTTAPSPQVRLGALWAPRRMPMCQAALQRSS